MPLGLTLLIFDRKQQFCKVIILQYSHKGKLLPFHTQSKAVTFSQHFYVFISDIVKNKCCWLVTPFLYSVSCVLNKNILLRTLGFKDLSKAIRYRYLHMRLFVRGFFFFSIIRYSFWSSLEREILSYSYM